MGPNSFSVEKILSMCFPVWQLSGFCLKVSCELPSLDWVIAQTEVNTHQAQAFIPMIVANCFSFIRKNLASYNQHWASLCDWRHSYLEPHLHMARASPPPQRLRAPIDCIRSFRTVVGTLSISGADLYLLVGVHSLGVPQNLIHPNTPKARANLGQDQDRCVPLHTSSSHVKPLF